MESKTLKVLEENIRIDMCGLEVEKNFLKDKKYTTEKCINLKIDKSDYIKIKPSVRQNMINKIKRQATGRKYVQHVIDK